MTNRFLITLFILILVIPVTASAWTSDSDIVAGLPTTDYFYTTPAVFNNSGVLTVIFGEYYGNFKGYTWYEPTSNYVLNSTSSGGLTDMGEYSAPAIYNHAGTWKLISGNSAGTFAGFYWSGAAWVSDSDIVIGLGDVGEHSSPAVYDDSGTFKLISGEKWGTFAGFYWSGAAWVSDSDIVIGLSDVGDRSSLTVYNDSGTFKLITGAYGGAFNGFYWNGAAWELDPTITNGLTEMAGYSMPCVYSNSGVFELITGLNDITAESDIFYGFTTLITTAPSLSSQTPTTPINDTTGSSRTFNATSNQSSNNKWLINGSLLEWDNSTTSPSYTNTSAQVGTWNISLIAFNSTDSTLSTIMTWIWTVTAAPTPTPTATAAVSGGGAQQSDDLTEEDTTNETAPAPIEIKVSGLWEYIIFCGLVVCFGIAADSITVQRFSEYKGLILIVPGLWFAYISGYFAI